MNEFSQLMIVPHCIFGIREILEAILDEAIHPPTLPDKSDGPWKHYALEIQRAIVDLAKIQCVCKYWHVFIQSSNYLQRRIGMKRIPVNTDLGMWNPVLFEYLYRNEPESSNGIRVTPMLRNEYTLAVAFLVFQQLPREQRFLRQIQTDHPFLRRTTASIPGRLLRFLHPRASWRYLVIPIGVGKFVLSVKKYSGSIHNMHNSPALLPLRLEHLVSGESTFTMNDVIAHFVQMAKDKRDGVQARDTLRRILDSWMPMAGEISINLIYREIPPMIIGDPILPISVNDLDFNGPEISKKRKLDEVSSE
jgi:hypothetical protein